MKIYDLDHFETISDDVTVFGGGEMSFSTSGSNKISMYALSTSKSNSRNTISLITGVSGVTLQQSVNLVKSIVSVTPSAVKGISKLVTFVSSIIKIPVISGLTQLK